MFKHYKDLSDVVSLLVYCPTEHSFLLSKETSGEYWIPSSRVDGDCWKLTASKIYYDLFGVETVNPCVPLRIYKVWLPNHPLSAVYHAIYKTCIKPDLKKKLKIKQNLRSRLSWFNHVELDRQRAHAMLRSPELAIFTQMAMGEQIKEFDVEYDTGILIEICESNLILSPDVGAGAAALSSPNYHLLIAAKYTKEDQIRLYREFVVLSFPAVYMSPHMFTTFMVDLGWQRPQCHNLFRAADITGRGGLSFLELMLWCAAMEPATQHSGVPAEIRCRYIFRFFDSNRDMKLEYVEFKELVAAARVARQLPVDALSVAKDADVCLRQLGIQPNSQIPLTEFLRGVGELRLRGTSSMLRAPRSVSGYLVDLQEREREISPNTSPETSKLHLGQTCTMGNMSHVGDTSQMSPGGTPLRRPGQRPDYNVAVYTVRLRRDVPNEMLELTTFNEDAVTASTARLVTLNVTCVNSTHVLGPRTCPVEAMAAVHYFATQVDKGSGRRMSVATNNSTVVTKCAWAWATPSEEAAMGALLLRLADAVRPICAEEPRLLRINSPVYVIGDLHGNLNALLTLETALWPSGAALAPAKMLFLGDFVDRGPHGTELMAYLLAAKLQRPHGVLLIRGNHETRDIQKMFTFYTPNKMTTSLALELTANEGFAANSKRGTGHVFDQTAIDRFLLSNQLSHVVRAHELHQNGFMCQLRGRLVSIFSSSHYCGGTNDSGAVLLEGGKLRLIRVGIGTTY
ncbi:uncharacterized protein LOC126368356 isoform X2 [Pectinophora gossypiella]|uniref:uncharacterized protein LOC126368356 isoform X2 n=1 Tax=Pectinophora gossypiella TaxID=13191 RepID=UPI00214E2E7C|nr:uncharacterized protein LOC126368356 isoform X2 [Pectinophora gossypiella]